jgi:putative transposase
MMKEQGQNQGINAWARLRFLVIGGLLAAPPAPGKLQQSLRELAEREWPHPQRRGEKVRFNKSTIERWYYRARTAADPVAGLARQGRDDAGRTRTISAALAEAIAAQHREHPGWSFALHWENLRVLARTEPGLGVVPSYATVRRHMVARGLLRQARGIRRLKPPTKVEEAASRRLEQREVRRFECTHVLGLWHLDFHSARRAVILRDGRRQFPRALAILDDCSRLCCHLQWYLQETAEVLVHGLVQAFAKRGLPRALMTDNGPAMIAEEMRQGLARLGIVHELTLPYSPHQNGKQEVFWAQVEGRLMAMLEHVEPLTLEGLNQASCAWVEQEYQRTVHRELRETPLERFLQGPAVGRPCPELDLLQQAFCVQEARQQRRSDGTLSVNGVRFEVPWRFHHLSRVQVRYQSWNLSRVYLVDERTGTLLARLLPLDAAAHASGRRRRIESDGAPAPASPARREAAPLLRQYLEEYAASGLPPAYLPFAPASGEESSDD